MGLATRVIPTALLKGRNIVKGRQFSADRVVGQAQQFVRVQQSREVDELVVLDVTATLENRGPDLRLVGELAGALFSPLSVGGGIRTIEQVRDVLRAGADKVVIGSGLTITGFLEEVAEKVGSQAITAAVDVKGGMIYFNSGRSRAWETPIPLDGYARWLEKRGAGEILLTSIDREGTMQGYDLKLISKVAHAVNIPVIAHGGCRDYVDMVDAIHAGASAVAAGALFQFTDCTPKGAARTLNDYGIEARV